MRKGPSGTKVLQSESLGSTKNAGLLTPAQWLAQQEAQHQAYKGELYLARLKQILTAAELQEVYAAGYGVKTNLELPESLALKINNDPEIKALIAVQRGHK